MARAVWVPALPSMQAPPRRHVLHAAPHGRTVVERLCRHLMGAAQLRDSELCVCVCVCVSSAARLATVDVGQAGRRRWRRAEEGRSERKEKRPFE